MKSQVFLAFFVRCLVQCGFLPRSARWAAEGTRGVGTAECAEDRGGINRGSNPLIIQLSEGGNPRAFFAAKFVSGPGDDSAFGAFVAGPGVLAMLGVGATLLGRGRRRRLD